VSGIPGLTEARAALLPLARRFAELSEEVKSKYVHEQSSYSFGWSHGKEKLDGNFDLSKGSYYGNPQYDRPVDDEELIAKYSPFIHPNIWPTDDLPELEAAFKDLGRLIVAVGTLVAAQCDRYVKKQCDSYPDQRLTRVIEGSLCCKARLLHYFDCSHDLTHENGSSESHDPFSSWCGWHNDHGSLTGLVSAMFLDADGNSIQNTDPNAGTGVSSNVTI
jgi:isopenicillin N synthase-like dioxygenase